MNLEELSIYQINTNIMHAQVTIYHLIWIPNPEFNLT